MVYTLYVVVLSTSEEKSNTNDQGCWKKTGRTLRLARRGRMPRGAWKGGEALHDVTADPPAAHREMSDTVSPHPAAAAGGAGGGTSPSSSTGGDATGGAAGGYGANMTPTMTTRRGDTNGGGGGDGDNASKVATTQPPPPRRHSPRGVKKVSTILWYTFAAMGFGTGWSSVDSIFQELNKYIEEYDDLGFASDLVYVTSCASATVFVVTFLGLYAAPPWIELRNERFFEATITTVLACSCVVRGAALGGRPFLPPPSGTQLPVAQQPIPCVLLNHPFFTDGTSPYILNGRLTNENISQHRIDTSFFLFLCFWFGTLTTSSLVHRYTLFLACYM